jgi:Response regulator containing a CheY-like receiver domain and an HTH DNA-binding domain
MRVLVVDDHEFTREGVIRILTDNFSIAKVIRAGTYEDAMEQIENGKFDLMILDINLPGKSGLEVLTSVRSSQPSLPILVLSMVPVSQYARRVLQAGATGYMTKSEPAEEFLKAVRAVSQGLRYFSPEVQQEIPDLVDESINRPKHDKLSDREFEILQRMADGKSSKEIAGEFKITPNTVNSYRCRIMAKLHAKSTTDVIKYAYKNKLLK